MVALACVRAYVCFRACFMCVFVYALVFVFVHVWLYLFPGVALALPTRG